MEENANSKVYLVWSPYYGRYEGILVGVFSSFETATKAALSELPSIYRLDHYNKVKCELEENKLPNIDGWTLCWILRLEGEHTGIEIHEENIDRPRVTSDQS